MLGQRLKKLRLDRKLTQKQLAEKIKVTHVSISGYENGNRYPDTDTLQRLADYFDVSTDYLLGRSNLTNTVPVAGQEIILSPEELLLFNELKKHPTMLYDLASDPEKKVKELIKLYKMKQILLEEEEDGEGVREKKD
ncbi:helix-turn-helix domain-containing protein [Sporosarcina sp. Te-1]|uniref:helix-turn-helix domain-containing protein n=1 Tax=Sporosarcina sp. Te-1 TaxID=2818390 RepID=UPI001A9EB60D|nr:helix-turn-helix transcriptional regulator [Sporosarcina sp. Te-1]QTD42144.1 helix-turn-helix transcriptional regulator [Sporosarcina sp. Te-1]